jgi:hypothetical protein
MGRKLELTPVRQSKSDCKKLRNVGIVGIFKKFWSQIEIRTDWEIGHGLQSVVRTDQSVKDRHVSGIFNITIEHPLYESWNGFQ